MKNEFRVIHFLIFIFSEARKMKNEKQIKFRLVHFSIFIFSGKMKNELRFCLIFIFCEKNWKMKNRQKFIFHFSKK